MPRFKYICLITDFPILFHSKMSHYRRMTKQEVFDSLDAFISKTQPVNVYGVTWIDSRDGKKIYNKMIQPDEPPQYKIFSKGLDGCHCFSLYKSCESKIYLFAVTMQNPNRYMEITSESAFDNL
jgi:hypothetical protein